MVEEKIPNQPGDPRPAQLRKHYYLDEYAVVAPARAKRPKEVEGPPSVSQKTESHPSIEDNQTLHEIPGRDGSWEVKVVSNNFPAFTDSNPEAEGAQEIVLETPQLGMPLGELSVENIQNVLEAYRHRIQQLRQRYGYISVFKNHGPLAGASLAHTHSQIIASSLIPPRVRQEREILSEYQLKHSTSALCDVIRWELERTERVVAHTRYTTTINPYASRYPLETWLIPNRQAHSIVDLEAEELRSLADHLKGVTQALTQAKIDFNFHLQEGIEGEHNHFFIKVTPRLTVAAGYEFNTDIYINPLAPEKAREWYQKHIKTPDVI